MRYLILMLAILAAAGCSRTSPEEAIRANIKAAQQAVEERDASDAVEHVAEHFLGNGRLTRQDLRRMLIGIFLRHQNINVVITRMDVNVNPHDPMSADMEGVVVATGAQNLLPQDGRIYKISGEWQDIDGEWMLVRLDWE